MFGSLLDKRQVNTPVREPAPTQLNTANYGNFLKVRANERTNERGFLIVLATRREVV